jgi:ribosomal protein L29
LMDERAELMGDARVSELRLELAEVRASSDLMAQALQGAVVVLGPIAAAVTQRLATPGAAPAGTPLVPGPTPDPAPELLAELAALRRELAGLRQAEAEAETQAHPGVAQ